VVALTDGSPMPSWLVLDASNMTFSAQQVPLNALPLTLTVTIDKQRTVVVLKALDN
jgi:hypothetical protein